MLHIAIVILKIIGIILLSVVGILLLLLFCALFVPLRYRIELHFQEGMDYCIRVTYVFGLFSVIYQKIHDKKKYYAVRFFGLDLISLRRKWKGLKRRNKVRKQDVMEHGLQEQDTIDDEFQKQEAPGGKQQETYRNNMDSVMNTQTSCPEQEETESVYQKMMKKAANLRSMIRLIWKLPEFLLNLPEKIPYIFKKIRDTMKRIKRNLKDTKKVLKDQTLWQAIRTVKHELWELWMKIRPRTIKGQIHFGCKNPEYTGKICGCIYSFYGWIPKQLRITTDFEHEILQGSVIIKGRFYGYYFIITLVKLMRDQNVKRWYRKLRAD